MTFARVAGGGQAVDRPRPAGFAVREMKPVRSSSRRRETRRLRGIPGAPSAISLKVRAPSSRFRRISGVQRVARISAALAIGQYWP